MRMDTTCVVWEWVNFPLLCRSLVGINPDAIVTPFDI